ncbi:inositol polyphosphate 1-phosphatase [Condylostylus longicornis]|uniref:inositol polyphosphate 1-phosphatase n=1 Tax=Condylostylus longicornis TaxID=2530218 RepID=UPI00244DFCCD|nr:inositol polyphosphate 1-phosphatase [Condylostylus longicornis]
MSRNFLRELVNVAEKSANVARKIREDPVLLELLIEEKNEVEANPRFIKDFKTLADVLIQEMIKYDIGKLFPELKSNIKGEESPIFTNSLGETVCIEIANSPEETATCLEVVLNGNKAAAKSLADVVHSEESFLNEEQVIPEFPEKFDYSKLGIWIDPIDATSQYIAGDTIFSNFPGITSTGLDCVTVLIGAYDIETGIPICGVINQPFCEKIEKQYKSKIFWGICLGDLKTNNLIQEETKRSSKIGLFSTSEHSNIIDTFKDEKYEIAFSAGAGHKALKVITGEADIYLLSKGTTYKWDTCAPHAILLSLNGCMYDFQKSLNEKKLIPLTYNSEEDKQNKGGVVAVKDIILITDLLERLS